VRAATGSAADTRGRKTFTLVIQDTANQEAKKDDAIPTKKIHISHLCNRCQCAINCASGKWQLEEQVEQFDSAAELVESYRDGKKAIVGERSNHFIGEPIRTHEVFRMLDKELKSAACAKAKYELSLRLLTEVEADEDWQLIADELDPDEDEMDALIAEKRQSIAGFEVIFNKVTRLRGVCRLLCEATKFYNDACREHQVASQLSHSWYWKVNGDEAKIILERERNPTVGYFCIRPRFDRDYDRPYALSYVSEITKNEQLDCVVVVAHYYIYWEDDFGFYLNSRKSTSHPLLTLSDFVQFHLKKTKIFDEDRDWLESKESLESDLFTPPQLQLRSTDAEYLAHLFAPLRVRH